MNYSIRVVEFMFVFGNAGRLGWIARSFHKFLKINSSELRGWSEPARRRAVLKGSAWTARRENGGNNPDLMLTIENNATYNL